MMNDVNILYICIFCFIAINLVAFFILYNIHIQKCLAWVGVSGTECFAGVQGGAIRRARSGWDFGDKKQLIAMYGVETEIPLRCLRL